MHEERADRRGRRIGTGLGVGLTLLAFSAVVPRSVAAQESDPPIALTGARVIDVTADAPIVGATVLVSDGRIRTVERDSRTVPTDARVIDLQGRYVLPGFIDAHVHIRTFDAAERALRSGVTTARSMGVGFADVGLRELSTAGRIEAPEILAAGYHVRPRPADGFFIDVPDVGDLLEPGVRGPAALRRMVQAMVERDVDWIKVNATERAGLPNTDPRKPTFLLDELAALVDEADRVERPVAAHAHGDEGGRAAVQAGVRSIEHGTYLSERTLRMMAERGTYLVPTIAVVEDLASPGGDYDDPVLRIRGRHMLPQIRRTAARAHALGVKIAAATDTGYGPESTLRIPLELEELVRVGLTPAQAIRAATTVAAELLGVADHTGRIAPGLDADLIVVDRNPLEDVGALHDILLVMNDGHVVLNRLELEAAPTGR